ncbi:MAG: hypothetical protein IJJ33_15910 [Victivallales bacterium]|nr:hypothetical protein [Victivallales bacterium]MBQ6473472.1 hypothetical protein [Victivallales bacterium]
MRITHINCPGCGKVIDIDWDWTYFLCQYCHAKCVIFSHNRPETPQETLERLHGEAKQTMEECNYPLAFGQYREILQHRIDDGEAWHGRALAIGMRSLDKENLRADEVLASFEEGLRRDPTPRSKLIYAMHASELGKTLHQFHYLHFRREPLQPLRWQYYCDAGAYALTMLRKSQTLLQELLELPDQHVPLLLTATEGYRQCSIHEQAEKTIFDIEQTIAAFDRALLTGSLRLHGKFWLRPKWFGIVTRIPTGLFPSKPREEFQGLQEEYLRVGKRSLGIVPELPKSEFDSYWTPFLIYGGSNLLLLAILAAAGFLIPAIALSLVVFFGFFRPLRHRRWENHCYDSDVRAGVYDYKP